MWLCHPSCPTTYNALSARGTAAVRTLPVRWPCCAGPPLFPTEPKSIEGTLGRVTSSPKSRATAGWWDFDTYRLVAGRCGSPQKQGRLRITSVPAPTRKREKICRYFGGSAVPYKLIAQCTSIQFWDDVSLKCCLCTKSPRQRGPMSYRSARKRRQTL